MRISDWSSDVCSSDLIEDLVAQTEYTNQGIALYQSAIAAVEQHKSREPWYQAALSFIPSIRSKRIIQHLHAISDELIRQEVQQNIQNPEKILPFMRPKENGRASCRERVCQYV